MKRKYTGMTLIEILMVVGIIVVLGGLLIPAMTLVKRTANQAKQREELNAIELAIVAFKNDYGDYPPSDYGLTPNGYGGAQKLVEALAGWDLLGFEPNSAWRADGESSSGQKLYSQDFGANPTPEQLETLKHRKGPYLDMTNIGVFRLNQLFTTPAPLAGGTYVFCDVFGARSVQVGNKWVAAGTPILYYKANQASKYHGVGACTDCDDRIYNFTDNRELINRRKLTVSGAQGDVHKLADAAYFYNDYIKDPKMDPIPWPYRPDSYLLITAGPDGEYGTKDDICNF